MNRNKEESIQYTMSQIKDAISELYTLAYNEGRTVDGQQILDIMTKEYQKGLDDAWKCAKRILQIGDNSIHSWDLEKIFKGLNSQVTAFEGTASEAIEKIATYEKEQKEKNGKKCEECMYYDYALGCVLETDCADYSEFVSKENTIKVGDEVLIDERRMLVLGIDSGGWKQLWCPSSGAVYDNITTSEITKTGRHFDIQSIIDQMEGE